MRYAKRSQCPSCNRNYGLQHVGVIDTTELYKCRFCGWVPEHTRKIIQRAIEELKQQIAGKKGATK